jgi:hypothetical protein
MRLDKIRSFHNTASYNQTASNRQSSNIFASDLKASMQSRIITEKKEGYIRRYRVHSDGTRELLSEELDVDYTPHQQPSNHELDLLKQLNFKR